MKKTGWTCLLVPLIVLLLVRCASETIIQRGDGTDTHPNRSMPLPTEEEIWGGSSGQNDPSEPMNTRVNVFRSGDSLYFSWGGDQWFEVWNGQADGDRVLQARSLCRDPLCLHNSNTCLNVMTQAANAIYRSGNDLYFMAWPDPCHTFVRYSLAAAETTVLFHPTDPDLYGGRFIGRLGNYIYYFYLRELEPDDKTMQVKQVTEVFRYHIPSGENVFLYEGERSEEMLLATGKSAELWYLSKSGHLIRSDANLHAKSEVSHAKMQTFALADEQVYYLTRFESGGSGELRRLDLSTGKDELLYENATWFAYDCGTLYYSLYDPMEGFAWDVRDTETGKLKPYTITVSNGNRIFAVEAAKAGSRGTPVTALDGLISDGWVLSSTFTVSHGVFCGCLMRACESEGRHGALNSVRAVDLESGAAVEITREENYWQ